LNFFFFVLLVSSLLDRQKKNVRFLFQSLSPNDFDFYYCVGESRLRVFFARRDAFWWVVVDDAFVGFEQPSTTSKKKYYSSAMPRRCVTDSFRKPKSSAASSKE